MDDKRLGARTMGSVKSVNKTSSWYRSCNHNVRYTFLWLSLVVLCFILKELLNVLVLCLKLGNQKFPRGCGGTLCV